MLKNYLKIAFRNIRGNFTYSFINIFGLAIGLASAIVIGLWVHQESTYDEHFENADRIVRVGVSFANIGEMAPGPEQFNEVVSPYPEVELTASLDPIRTETITVGSRDFEESNIFMADSNFFDMFSYRFLEGSSSSALKSPNTVVLTKELARKYFPNSNAIGKTIELGEEKTVYTITGVIEKQGDSHIPAEIFLHFEPADDTNWRSATFFNYVLLREGVSLEEFQDRLDLLIKNRVYPSLELNQPYEEWIQTSSAYQFIPMPITDIYLKSNLRFDLDTGGDETNVYIFALVSLFIIIIAGVNFINITTARSSNRAKEVGIRKTLGTGRYSLVTQFLAESVIICLIALIISFGLAETFLSVFEQYTGVELLNSLFNDTGQLVVITGIAILIGILAGLYPAFYLSSFQPVSVLKGDISLSKNSLFRNALVVVQFTIAIGLLSCTGLVYQQLQYMQTKDMGLDVKDVLVITNSNVIGDQKDSFKQQLLSQTGVVEASYNARTPAGTTVWVNSFRTREMEDGLPVQTFVGDYDYISTMGFQLIEGRNFSRDVAGDTAAVILNQAALKALNIEEPIGTQLNDNNKVIGVVSNFNFESLRNPIEPVAITLGDMNRRMAVKINSANVSDLLSQIQEIWRSYNFEEPMDYYFLDQNYAELVSREKVLARAILLFSVLAIIISCLGLYGLSAYICELRTKEIGIRKVLGATVSDIIVHLTKDFTKPVAVAIVVAVPLAFIVMYSWLSNFAFKIEIGPWVFIVSCLGGLAIAWITVSWQSFKTALMHPVESLRSE
jgi:putative ABC transport system permease protein